ncbi:MAG: PAS domain S-box protein, partial [Bacteroidota bacterium]
MKTLLPIPKNEQERLKALRNYEILDTLDESEFDRLTKLASLICDTPMSAVSLIDMDRQWLKSVIGLTGRQTSRDEAFCAHTIMDENILEVEDATADVRFKDNPSVTGIGNIRFYAGAPLIDPQGYALGSLCVIDTKPRLLSQKQKEALTLLAEEAISLIVDRRQREELRNFEKVFNLSNDLVFVGGTDGYFKKINPAFTKIFGWTEDELLNTSSFEFYHPDDLKNTEKELKKLSKGQNTVNFQQRFKTKEGEYKTIEWTSSPEPFTGNIFGIGRDVSELVLKETQLAASEERLRVFFQNSLGMMFTHDLQGKILSINNSGAAVLGYSRDELLQMSLYDISVIDRHSAVDDYLQKIKADGHVQGQTSTQHKDGSVRIWMYNNILEDSTDAEPYVIVNGMDITNRYKLEKDLKRTTSMLEQTNTVARVGGWEYDLEKQTIYWSSVTKAIHGVDDDYEPNPQNGLSFYDKGEEERVRKAIQLATTDGTSWDQERLMTTAKGEKIWVRSIGNAEFENGVCKRLFGTFQDINDFKSTEFALQRSLETQ